MQLLTARKRNIRLSFLNFLFLFTTGALSEAESVILWAVQGQSRLARRLLAPNSRAAHGQNDVTSRGRDISSPDTGSGRQ